MAAHSERGEDSTLNKGGLEVSSGGQAGRNEERGEGVGESRAVRSCTAYTYKLYTLFEVGNDRGQHMKLLSSSFSLQIQLTIFLDEKIAI